MFVFMSLHFANHALLLVSLDVAEAARNLFQLAWRSWPGTILLYGSIAVHFGLSLHAIAVRRTLRMPFREAAQIALGLALPFLILGHVVATRVEASATNVDVTYRAIAHALWVRDPLGGVQQVAALAIGWLHGCIGLFFWLRFRPRFPAFAPYLLVAAALLPVLATLGFAQAGRAVERDGYERQLPSAKAAAQAEAVAWVEPALFLVLAGGLAGVLLLHGARFAYRRRNQVRISYGDGIAIAVDVGTSVLEASRIAGIPHYAICGGRGRCSTCRVQVVSGASTLPAPSATESATLQRIGAGTGVRLACQLRPKRAVSVVPVLEPQRHADIAPAGLSPAPGEEADIAVLFCDLRDFTAISEAHLPFDVVFLLNRYFAIVGRVVEKHGGRIDKFIGDGAMAVFASAPDDAGAECRRAIAAAMDIGRELADFGRALTIELHKPIRSAIGVHSGSAIVGRMGFGSAMALTAVGDTVNIASRLETAAKELDAFLVVSRETAERAKVDLSVFEMRELTIRGRIAPLSAYVVPRPDLEPPDERGT